MAIGMQIFRVNDELWIELYKWRGASTPAHYSELKAWRREWVVACPEALSERAALRLAFASALEQLGDRDD